VNPEQWPAEVNRYYVPELMIPLRTGTATTNSGGRGPIAKRCANLQDIIDIEERRSFTVHNFPPSGNPDELRIQVPIVEDRSQLRESLAGIISSNFPAVRSVPILPAMHARRLRVAVDIQGDARAGREPPDEGASGS